MPTSRLRLLAPDELDAEQRDLHTKITEGTRAHGPQMFALTDPEGHLNGPFNAMLLSPPLGRALQELGSSIRYASALTPRTRETAILVVAAAWDSEYEQHAHEPLGRAAGLSDTQILALRAGDDPQPADPEERAAWSAVHALVRGEPLDDAWYAATRETLNERTLFELSTLVGYYTTLALQLRLFGVHPPHEAAQEQGQSPKTPASPSHR